MGLEGATLWAAGSALGGGLARRQWVCGALSGAAVALGVYYAQNMEDRKAVGRSVRPKVNELLQGFIDAFGSAECRHLIPVDYTTPNWYEEFKAKNVKQERCDRYVSHVIRTTVGWAEAGTVLPAKG